MRTKSSRATLHWRVHVDPDHVEILHETVDQYLQKPGLYFPYKTSMTHSRHQTEVSIALKQVQKLKRYYKQVFESDHSDLYEQVARGLKWRSMERNYGRLQTSEKVLQLIKKILEVERAGGLNEPYGFTHREMQEEIVAAARAYGVGGTV